MLGPKMLIGLTMLGTMASICNFSLDAAMINSINIMDSFYEYFKLNSTYTGLNVSLIYIGSVVAVPFAGPLLDRLGRKRGLIVAAALGLIGAILQAAAHEKAQLLIGRFVLGTSFIVAGAGGPSWVMEIAPPKHRSIITNSMLASLPITGTIGSIIYFGIWDSSSNWAWRGGLMSELVGPAIALIVLPFTPESVRWLVSQGREDEALATLVRLRGVSQDDPELVAEFSQIKHTIDHERAVVSTKSWRPLIKPAPNLRRFLIATLCNVFWQINGTNFMPYFFTIIIQAAGVTDVALLLKINIGLCAWATCANMCGIVLISTLGRRAMFLLCTPVLAISFAVLAALQHSIDTTHEIRFGIGAVVICFIFQFAAFASWMILNFSYPSEILKYTQRARGVVASQAVGYAIGVMMTYTTPIAIENISWKYYALNAAWNVPMVAVIWWMFPETKGKTLEEIDTIFEGAAAETWLHDTDYQVIDGKPMTKAITTEAGTSPTKAPSVTAN